MKISYNNLKRYKNDLKSPNDLALDLIMHTAEVEEVISKWDSFDNIVVWEIKDIQNHPDADNLKVCIVDAWWPENLQIVCGGTNLKLNQKVAVAKIWAVVSWHGKEVVTMKKTKIRWVESYWMICASEEIWLKDEFPAKTYTEILDLSGIDAKNWERLDKVLKKDEVILEIDNKAINHRPDLFSHIWILREIYAINNEKFDYSYKDIDFSDLKELKIENQIPKFVKRYIGLKISNVENINSPDYIKEVLQASSVSSKWLLIDLSNYSLYFYGQPTHIFDADKIDWDIIIRFAKSWESFVALDDKEYILTDKDIVIADNSKILALAWIIGAKSSAVWDSTKNIIIESANFDHAILRASGKRLGIRTDSLNIFEKDLLPVSAKWWVSLIVDELEKIFKELKKEAYNDIYTEKQQDIFIDYDLNFINNLIGKEYKEEEVLRILNNLWIEKIDNKLKIPAWRKDLKYKADIAEEIARIDWYDKIEAKVPEIQLWAIIQNNIYKAKKIARDFFVENWFFDMYTYSFVNKQLMEKCNSFLSNCVPLKNFLSEDATHMKNSLVPNLLLSLEKNRVDFKTLKLFEVEKVFFWDKNKNDIKENYNLSAVISDFDDNIYYQIQNILMKFLRKIWIEKFEFKKDDDIPDFAHKNKTWAIIVRWQKIGFIWEIKPKVIANFELKTKVWFFELNLEKLAQMLGSITKYKEISEFQGSSFDISFAIDKNFEWYKLQKAILNTNPKIIQKVILTDIYENEEKLPWKRSVSFKVFLQKMDSEVTDKEKNEIIAEIIKRAEKLWAQHR